MAKKSMKYQVKLMLSSKCAYGTSRSEDKATGDAYKYIYSRKTYETYVRECTKFAEWAKNTHGCVRVDQAIEHASEYIEKIINDGKSPYTIKTSRSALGKLYGVPGTTFGDTPERSRKTIYNSRHEVSYDKHYSPEKHSELTNFVSNTGLRTSEVHKFKPSDVSADFSHIRVTGKGGKTRDAFVMPEYREELKELCRKYAPNAKIFNKTSKAANLHALRSDYATNYYNSIARLVKDTPINERYYCRNDLSGIVYDRVAMREVSRSLGHERITVIAGHYLR